MYCVLRQSLSLSHKLSCRNKYECYIQLAYCPCLFSLIINFNVSIPITADGIISITFSTVPWLCFQTMQHANDLKQFYLAKILLGMKMFPKYIDSRWSKIVQVFLTHSQDSYSVNFVNIEFFYKQFKTFIKHS